MKDNGQLSVIDKLVYYPVLNSDHFIAGGNAGNMVKERAPVRDDL